MDENLLIQASFFVLCLGLGMFGTKVANKFIHGRVTRAISIGLVRGLFFTPTIIITTGLAVVPSIFALVALQWAFLVPAAIVFMISIHMSLRRGATNFGSDF